MMYPDVARLLQGELVEAGGNRKLTLFRSPSIDLVKADFVFPEAGFAYQPQLLCAVAAAKLMVVATEAMGAQALSEFLDARGVVVDSTANLRTANLTVYTHRRYADEVMAAVHDMIGSPAFAEADFEVWRAAKRQELAVQERRTSAVARRIWYQHLFGPWHPLGCTASAADVDRLQLQEVKEFFLRHYSGGDCGMVLSGNADDRLVSLVGRCAPQGVRGARSQFVLPEAWPHEPAPCRCEASVEGAQQASLRIGCRLPSVGLPKEDMMRMSMVTTLLGGWFGSRLMGNLREDKGYTYGVSAHIIHHPGCPLFFIQTDVASDVADAAVEEVLSELRRLADEPPSQEEVDMVKNVMAGDAMRLLDGVFERSDRTVEMWENGPAPLFDKDFGSVLRDTTPAHLRDVAARWFAPERMTVAVAR